MSGNCAALNAIARIGKEDVFFTDDPSYRLLNGGLISFSVRPPNEVLLHQLISQGVSRQQSGNSTQSARSIFSAALRKVLGRNGAGSSTGR